MNVAIEDEQDLAINLMALRRIAVGVLQAEGFPPDTELSVTLVGDARIGEMNQRFLGRDGPTDVLSFPLSDLRPGVPPPSKSASPPFSLGDVVISPAYVKRQAEEYEVEMGDEMALMLVHGILHLMGYDHEQDDDAESMEERERVLLAATGIVRR